jgi:ElaB/YqjD/DUF883 family membrane-anchored ribosome-binding protein
MENHTSQTREALLKDVDKLKRNAGQVVQDVKDHASAHVDETRQRVTDTLQSVRESVTDQPLALLGIGFVAGLLIGLRLAR